MHCLSFFFFFFFNDTATTEIYTLSLHDALPIWRSGRSCWRKVTRVLLVPDLPLERWPSMDRYAHRLYDWLESTDPGFEVRLAAQIGALTRETKDGRRSGGYPRWWAQDVDPTSLVLPGPLRDPQRYVARYFFYPWWLKRDAKRARLVHILDHSYAHMVTRVHRSEEHTSELQSQSNLVCRLLLEK